MERKFKVMVGQLNRHYDSNLEKVNQASLESVRTAKTPLFAQLGKLTPVECWKLLKEIGNLESIEENYTFLLGLTDYIACECNELGLHIPPDEAILWDYNPLKYIEELAQTWKKFLPFARADLMQDSFNFLVSSLIESLSILLSKQINVSSFEVILDDVKMFLPAGKHHLLSKIKIPKPEDGKTVTKTNRKKNKKHYQAPILQNLNFKPLKVDIQRRSAMKKKSPPLPNRDKIDMPISVDSSSYSSSRSSSPPFSSCDDANYLLDSDEDVAIFEQMLSGSNLKSSLGSSKEVDEKDETNDYKPNGHSNTKSCDLNEAFYSISDSSCSSVLSSTSDDISILYDPYSNLSFGDSLGVNSSLSAVIKKSIHKNSLTSALKTSSSTARSVGKLSQPAPVKYLVDAKSNKRKFNPSMKDISNLKDKQYREEKYDLDKTRYHDSAQSKDAFSVLMTSRSKEKASLWKKQKVGRN
ncbi:uncharacterized protein LOC144352342 [Saccoglossus kowalevskii]